MDRGPGLDGHSRLPATSVGDGPKKREKKCNMKKLGLARRRFGR
jgi:hypothetical protein